MLRPAARPDIASGGPSCSGRTTTATAGAGPSTGAGATTPCVPTDATTSRPSPAAPAAADATAAAEPAEPADAPTPTTSGDGTTASTTPPRGAPSHPGGRVGRNATARFAAREGRRRGKQHRRQQHLARDQVVHGAHTNVLAGVTSNERPKNCPRYVRPAPVPNVTEAFGASRVPLKGASRLTVVPAKPSVRD